jgi:hypothetical protein
MNANEEFVILEAAAKTVPVTSPSPTETQQRSSQPSSVEYLNITSFFFFVFPVTRKRKALDQRNGQPARVL